MSQTSSFLCKDLALAVIGDATARGRIPDVPWLIRSAAQSWFLATDGDRVLSSEVLGLLHSGYCDWHPLYPVDVYHGAWWSFPGSEVGHLKKAHLLRACQNHFRQVGSCLLFFHLARQLTPV